MKLRSALLLAASSAAAVLACRAAGIRPLYPDTHRGEVVDDYHGEKIADPYRWLEDADSPETRAWVAAEIEVTFAFLDGIPERERIRARLTELWDHERFELPVQQGGRVFFRKNDGLQNQSVLYVADTV